MPRAARALIALLAVACVAPGYGETRYRVVGASMQPTFEHGDVIAVDEGYFDGRDLERGVLVAIRLRTRAVPMVKRVVAVAGDRVTVQGDRLQVDGRFHVVHRRGASLLATQLSRYGNQVPRDHFIALGDNPAASFDSAAFGLLSRRQILGRVRVPEAGP